MHLFYSNIFFSICLIEMSLQEVELKLNNNAIPSVLHGMKLL